MEGFISSQPLQLKRISPEDGFHYFYGYYDNPAFDTTDTLHLCNRVKFMDRLPDKNDVNQLGYFNLQTGKFTPLAETTAWNFQQGSMLQWSTQNPKEVIYNIWDGSEYRSVVQNISTNSKRTLDYPVANVSPDGKWGLSINFNRVYDFRPGYGYCQVPDKWLNEPTPSDDGVILMNMETGKGKLIVTYSQLDALFNVTPETKGAKIVINHITFNSASDRFLFLVRFFPKEGQMWRTGLGTCDLEGNVFVLSPYTYASHYFWHREEKDRLMIYADCGEGDGLYELTDKTSSYKIYDKAFFNQDIHCSYSREGKFIIGDGYPRKDDLREIFLYNIEKDKGILLAKVLAPPVSHFDIRSDLHCRFSNNGRLVSFDSIHEGFRGLYTIEIDKTMENI